MENILPVKLKYCNGSPAVEINTTGGLIAVVSVDEIHLDSLDFFNIVDII